ncbi:MAG TPA: hypothetical protein ENJ75_01490 [Candidatus Kaiserbacteria bacterium]|nr:hypothetical protein [Candidatus Kaiserbacteria bacterium]
MATVEQLARRYAHAISHVSNEARVDDSSLVKNLVAHLKQNGRLKLLPHIARELENESARAQARAPKLEVAREEDKESAIKELHKKNVFETKVTVNRTLIRGWRVRTNNTLIDNSAKHSLVELYRNIIH